ncbi:MAG: PspC domain-containing protein [Patescibacteria group bacterium]
MKKLTRSRDNRVIWGVLGGVGEYFNIDPVICRLIFILLTLPSGLVPGILIYIVATIIIPEEPLAVPNNKPASGTTTNDEAV